MNKKLLCLLVSGAVLFSVAGCGKDKKNDESEKSTGINVEVADVIYDKIQNKISYTGEIKPTESVSITPKVNAKTLSVKVIEGDYVKKGQVLATLDKTDIQLSYAQAEASYNSAVANYEMTKNSTTVRNMTQAEQNFNSAQIAYESALTNYEREKELYDQNSNVKLAEQNYNDAVSAYERAKTIYENDTNMIAARNAYNTAKDNYARYTELYKQGAISKVEFDNAKTNMENAKASFDTAEINNKAAYDNALSMKITAEENLNKVIITASASLDAAKTALDNAENNLKSSEENISLTEVANSESLKTAKASVDSAKANLNSVKNNIENTTITAPISGFVATVNLHVGQMAQAGAEAFSIKNANSVNAEIKVTESVIADIELGTKATVDVKSADIENIEGAVTVLNPVKDDRTGMYTVKVTIENDDNRLNVGMFADITLITREDENALVVPVDAIMQEGEDYYVYVAEDNKAVKRIVEKGIEDAKTVQIIEGLDAGDKVVVSGKEYISEENNEIILLIAMIDITA